MLRIGLIGAGEIAQVSHLPMLRNLPDLYTITGITDISQGLCQAVQARFAIPRVFDSAEALIASSEVDAVMVLTADPYHCEYTIKSLEAGKHVFVEKPAAMNSSDVRRMIAAEKNNRGIVMVGYMRRYASPFLKAKELLARDNRPVTYLRCRDIIREGDFYLKQTSHTFSAQDFGDLPEGGAKQLAEMKHEQHSVALGKDAKELQRNVYQMLLGLGCHTLSAVKELVGEPQKVVQVLSSGNGTHFVALLQYDGFIATYELINDQTIVDFDAAIEIFQGDRKLKIKYETPYIRFQPHYLEVIQSTQEETKTTLYGPDYHDAFETELRTFHDCAIRGVRPKTSLEDALSDLLLYEKMANMSQKEG